MDQEVWHREGKTEAEAHFVFLSLFQDASRWAYNTAGRTTEFISGKMKWPKRNATRECDIWGYHIENLAFYPSILP